MAIVFPTPSEPVRCRNRSSETEIVGSILPVRCGAGGRARLQRSRAKVSAARDPMGELRARLRRLYSLVGGPTYQRLAGCAAAVGERLPSSTLGDLLGGSRL